MLDLRFFGGLLPHRQLLFQLKVAAVDFLLPLQGLFQFASFVLPLDLEALLQVNFVSLQLDQRLLLFFVHLKFRVRVQVRPQLHFLRFVLVEALDFFLLLLRVVLVHPFVQVLLAQPIQLLVFDQIHRL